MYDSELKFLEIILHLKLLCDFSGGAVYTNLPASAGDMGSVPGPGRSHVLQSN